MCFVFYERLHVERDGRGANCETRDGKKKKIRTHRVRIGDRVEVPMTHRSQREKSEDADLNTHRQMRKMQRMFRRGIGKPRFASHRVKYH